MIVTAYQLPQPGRFELLAQLGRVDVRKLGTFTLRELPPQQAFDPGEREVFLQSLEGDFATEALEAKSRRRRYPAARGRASACRRTRWSRRSNIESARHPC